MAIRYGAALADPQVAAMVARGKTASAHVAASNGGTPSTSHADTPSTSPTEAPGTGQAEVGTGHAEADAGQAKAEAGQAEAPPPDDDTAESQPASVPPAGSSAQ